MFITSVLEMELYTASGRCGPMLTRSDPLVDTIGLAELGKANALATKIVRVTKTRCLLKGKTLLIS